MISPEVVKLFGWEGGWLVSIMSCCLSVGSDVALFVMYLSNAPQQPILSIHQCCVWDLPNTVSLSRRFFDVLVPPRYEKGCTLYHTLCCRSPQEGFTELTLTLGTLPGESHGGRSLVGYSPWGHKGSDTTERLHYDIFRTYRKDSYSSCICFIYGDFLKPVHFSRMRLLLFQT